MKRIANAAKFLALSVVGICILTGVIVSEISRKPGAMA